MTPVSSELSARRPQAVTLLARAHRRAITVLGPDRWASAAVAVTAVTGVSATTPAAPHRGRDPWSGFADQFVLDVTSLRDETDHAPTKELVTALYVVEAAARVRVMSMALLGGHLLEVTPDGDAHDDADLRTLWIAYQDCAMTGDALDPLLTEVVRLRCARTHACRICSTLRLADARDAGVDQSVTDQIDRYESSDLPERAKAALRLTDAQISRPDLLDADAVAQARAVLSAEECAELILDVAKWSTQKVNVATGTDGIDGIPLDDDGVAWLAFDDAGHPLPFRADVQVRS